MSQISISPNIKHRHHHFPSTSSKINSLISEWVLFHSNDSLEIQGTLCFFFCHAAVKEMKDSAFS